MIEPSLLVGFLILGIAVGIAAPMATHSAWQAIIEKWDNDNGCHDATEGRDAFYCPTGYTVMDVPDSEYSKLMYIRNHGVESFVDACKRGDFSAMGVNSENY